MAIGAPYRDAGIPASELDHDQDEIKPLASFVVSGRPGQAGRDGAHGASGSGSGAHGERGQDAGPAEMGEHAGTIRLELEADAGGLIAMRGTRVEPSDQHEAIHGTVLAIDQGFIELRAIGGRGGDGGDGGAGGNGARGSAGADATRWSSGGDGGPGGDGADGGNATSGAPGGRGGAITVAVSDDDTPLLMLIDHDVSGGGGGKPGRNGTGGAGGAGGSGGDSYSWTTTSSYRDSNGNTQTRTHYHSNPGGSSGPSGSNGRAGSAQVRAGASGANGAFAIEVKTASGVKKYASRYDLRLAGFAHDSANQDHVYEPGELVRVFDVEVENVGGMPTPAKDDLRLSLIRDGWVLPEAGDLVCPPGLEPRVRHRMTGELMFRIAEHTPSAPSDPLEVEESILHRAVLPSVHREFADYQTTAAHQAGLFVIRHPLRVSATSSLRSLAAGAATKVKFSITNQSRHPLGAQSPCKRVVRVAIATSPDSELTDEHVVFVANGVELPPSKGWTHEVPLLGAGEEIDLEITVRVRDDAPEYRRYAAQLSLELGRLDQPAETKPIQLRAFDLRVARPFKAADADVLLVVNHKTTREEVVAWEALADELACKVAIWDLTLERHLDLEAPVADGKSLCDLLGRGSIAILDNEIDGSDGPTHPHVFLCPEQALRAAAGGIDIAFLGKGLTLDHMLVPTDDPSKTSALATTRKADDVNALVELAGKDARCTVDVHRRFLLRFWAKPQEHWLERRAHDLSERLARSHPAQRHFIVPMFKPEVVSKFLWIKRWRVGSLDTLRTLDTAEGALLHVAISDEQLHDPTFAISSAGSTALLLLLDFDDKLERLRALGEPAQPDAEPDRATLDHIVDLLLVDLAGELVGMARPGWRSGATAADYERGMPYLRALSAYGLRAEYTSVLGTALLRLAGQLDFLARSQVRIWEAIPPLRWTRRTPALVALVREHLERFMLVAFGAHNINTAKAAIRAIARELEAEYDADSRGDMKPPRHAWALERYRAPLAAKHITSDVELLTGTAERVITSDAYADIIAAKTQRRSHRERLVADAARAHDTLLA